MMAKIHIPQRYDEQKQDIYVHLTSKVKNTPLRIKKNGLNNTLTKKMITFAASKQFVCVFKVERYNQVSSLRYRTFR